MLKFSLGSYSGFPIFADLVHVSRKRLIVERNGAKFGPQVSISAYRVLLTVKCSMSVGGYSVLFQFLTTLYLLLT